MLRAPSKGPLRTPLSRQRGNTMMEVLVSTVILSTGLLGVAGLQGEGLRTATSAWHRTLATWQARDIADRVRANPAGRAAGYYDNPAAYPTTLCDITGDDCTPLGVAANDISEWQQSSAQVLPGGDALICRDSTPDDAAGCDLIGNTYVVTLTWMDDRRGEEVVFVTSFTP